MNCITRMRIVWFPVKPTSISSIFSCTKDDETVITPDTKDNHGKYISTPTAQNIADDLGIGAFNDNSGEYDKDGNKIEPDEDGDPSDFWFLI